MVYEITIQYHSYLPVGVRSPMNQATSYLDGSQIYGVDVDEQLKLRAGVGGKEQNSRCMKNKSCTIKTLLLLIGNYL